MITVSDFLTIGNPKQLKNYYVNNDFPHLMVKYKTGKSCSLQRKEYYTLLEVTGLVTPFCYNVGFLRPLELDGCYMMLPRLYNVENVKPEQLSLDQTSCLGQYMSYLHYYAQYDGIGVELYHGNKLDEEGKVYLLNFEHSEKILEYDEETLEVLAESLRPFQTNKWNVFVSAYLNESDQYSTRFIAKDVLSLL